MNRKMNREIAKKSKTPRGGKRRQAENLVQQGVDQLEAGQTSRAEELFFAALRLWPECVAALIYLGTLQAERQDFRQATLSFGRAVQIDPNCEEGYNSLGLILEEQQRYAEAEAFFRKALELRPVYAEAYNNLALLIKKDGRVAEAEDYLRRAIELAPDYPDCYYNLANLLKSRNRFNEAEELYRLTIDRWPEFINSYFSLATLHLLLERFETGWNLFEQRYGLTEKYYRKFPRWHGESLAGKSILLYFDQGFGDTIQFLRFAYGVANQAAKTVVWVPQALERLFAMGKPPFSLCSDPKILDERFDYSCPLLSLPAELQVGSDLLSGSIPYLHPDSELIKQWRNALAPLAKPRVGVVWAGNPKHDNDHNRSVPFAVFRELFTVPAISWVSLEVGERAKDLGQTTVKVLNPAAELTDFAETAAVIENLDLVITVDSAVAHLAGSLGKPTWVLIPFVPDWRWGVSREDCLWYPSVRLFRQKRPGDWSEVLARVKQQLCSMI